MQVRRRLEPDEGAKRKAGSGVSVVVETILATQPGVVIWSRYFDPKTDSSVRVEGETVVEFPKLKEFHPVTDSRRRPSLG